MNKIITFSLNNVDLIIILDHITVVTTHISRQNWGRTYGALKMKIGPR